MTYNPSNNIFSRFFSLTCEGFKEEPSLEDHKPNYVEKLGNGLLYIPNNLPRVVKKICTNPQVIATTTCIVADLAISYFFYPEQTTRAINFVASYLPTITLGTVKEAGRFALWAGACDMITGYCLRAGGRLTDSYCNRLAELNAEKSERQSEIKALKSYIEEK